MSNIITTMLNRNDIQEGIHLKVKLTHPDAQMPSYKYPTDSGMDIRAVEDTYIRPGCTAKVNTGVAFGIPKGFELQIRPRSGLAGRGIAAEFGTIDQAYRDQLAVIITNHTNDTFKFEKGDRIAQVVLAPVSYAFLALCDELDDTDRGTNGHGSSGLK